MNTPSYATASLYVGDLLPEVNETTLFELFKQVGPVASIRVCRDSITRRSLGYAYVNFHVIGDAERALDFINYKEIKGKPCRIMWSQRDPALRRNGTGNIFIKNLDKSIDNKLLYETFSPFGNILSCKISTDENGNSRGFGFVHYETDAAAEGAIKGVNGNLLEGKKAFVGLFVPKKDRLKEFSPKWTNIYIKNLSKTVGDDKFKELFSKYGTITSAVLSKDEQGQSRGFGFINYGTHEEAQAAIDDMNGKDIDGTQVYVGRAQKKSEREKELRDVFEKLKRERMSKYQGVNLYVKNLDESIDDAKLRQEFSHVGTITSAKVMKDDKNASKGFGFVCFATPDEATKAVTEMNGKMILAKPIYVALAQRKEQRRAQLEAQHAARATGIRMQQQAQATGTPMYAAGPAPVFFPPGGRGGFAYATAPVQGYRPPQSGGFRGGNSNVGYRVQSSGRGQSRGGRGGKNVNARGGNQQAGNYPGIKYNQNVRNPQQQQPVQSEPQVSSEERKLMLGENLFPLISDYLRNTGRSEELAGKITGMVLELSEAELLGMIQSTESLAKKVSEALEVLAVHSDAEEKQQ
jgi:polyadenylate-binding protein